MTPVRPALLVLSGLPGTSKTTLAREVCRRIRAVHLRVDAVEAALTRCGLDPGPSGYAVAHELARGNLALGTPVVVDAVCAVAEARQGWAATARDAGALLVQVGTVLGDAEEHRRRVEGRRADLDGHRVPTWQDVVDRRWDPWDELRDGPRTVVDTTVTEDAVRRVLTLIGE